MSLTDNKTKIQQLLDGINALPEASSGVELPTLTNEGIASDLLSGKQLIKSDGTAVTGTMPNNGTISKTIDGLNTKTATIPSGYTSGGTVTVDDTVDNIADNQATLLAQAISALESKASVGQQQITLQEKTVSSSTSKQTVTPDSGYDGLSKVTVNAMATATQATPSISVSSSGLITASSTQSAGYVAAGTKSATKQLTVQAAQTITPSTSNKTIASGRYLTGTQTIKGDANLVAGNIKSGVSIFGVAGSLQAGEDITAETTAYTNLLDDLEEAVNALPDASGGSSGGVETCTVTITSANSSSTFRGIFYHGYVNGEITNNSISNAFANSSVTIEAVKGTAIIMSGDSMDAKAMTVNSGLELRSDDYVNRLYYGSNTMSDTLLYRVLADGATLTFKYNPCFVRGTLISLADGTTKPVEDISYNDKLLVWDFDNACYASAYPLWIKEKQETKSYYRCSFDNGTVLRLVGSNGRCHRMFSLDRNMFESATECVGERIMTMNGVAKLLSCEVVEETVDFYNIITDHHLNLYADSVLTSCRLNNLYPIENMQFVKEEREVIPLDSYAGVGEVYYKGLRLGERKQEDVSMITEYVSNLYKLATTSLYTLM